MSKRSIAADLAKGIGIILVVYGHALRGLVSANIISPESHINFTDYYIYTFHMPLFFIISGSFFKINREPGSEAAFFSGNIKKIVYPYFLWSIIQGCIQIAMSGSATTNRSMEPSRLLEIAWNPISPFWFLYALFFSQLIWFLIRDRLKPEIVLAAAFVIFLALRLAGAPQTLEDVGYGFLYFSLGIWLSQQGIMERLPTSWLAAIGAALVGLALTVGCYLLGVPERLPFVAAIANLVAVLSICRAIEAHAPASWTTKFLVLFGQCSMGIYVLHIMVIGVVRFAETRVLGVHNEAALLVSLVIAGILIPTIIQLVAIYLRVQNLVGLPASATLFKRKPNQTLAASEAKTG